VDVEKRRLDGSFDEVYDDIVPVLDVLTPLCRGTFFVTGEVAKKSPIVVRATADRGHEIACHGLYHEPFDILGLDQQFARIRRAAECIENAGGGRPSGFRAPYHRANANTILALERSGYGYDSSVLPRTPFMRPEAHKKWHFLFAPTGPYHPSSTAIHRQGDCKILEIPCSTLILPFVSKLTMTSQRISDLLAHSLVHLAARRGTPIVYYLHSYDSWSSNGNLTWLKRLVTTLRQCNVTFATMSQVSQLFRQEGGPF